MKVLKIAVAGFLILSLSGCYGILCSLFTDYGAHNCWGGGYNGFVAQEEERE